jgi:hypothetical protein
MDTLHDRLAELADDAPTGGAQPAELWARGKRAHRLRSAGLAAALLVVGAVGTDIGVHLADGDRSGPAPAGTVGIALPIEYPAGDKLPDLGDTPGPLAAIWLDPRAGSGAGAPEAVGLVAESGTFGTLPIDLPDDDPEGPDYMTVALSPDGRRMAYPSPTGELIVHDLVTGDNYSPAIETRAGFTWIDATHLFGHVAGGSDADGWVWEPGTAPTLVDFYTVTYGETDLSVPVQGGGPGSCAPPTVQNVQIRELNGGADWAGAFDVPVLCDVLGITSSEILLGHWNSGRSPGDWNDPNDGNTTVVALDIHGADPSFEDPSLRHVVVTAGAPERVTLASDLIGEALDATGGAS